MDRSEHHSTGREELRASFNRNLGIAFAISLLLHVAVILFYAFTGDVDLPSRVVLNDIPRPHMDTVWTEIRMDEPKHSSTQRPGGGSPDVQAPEGPSSKGHEQATPDHSRNLRDPSRSVVPKNPDNIHVVKTEPKPPKVAASTSDTSRSNVIGTRGQNPHGTGDHPSGGSGGPGVGIGSADGLGSRGWVVRPHATYPSGTNVTGVVTLRFTVLPNGDITNITPVKRADQALVNAAMAGMRRAKARPLPDDAPQVAQTAIIPFTFKLQ
ncbi:MAG: TonB family protein [Bacteroidetes bacterium]|nr:TonB family protein [Bacteroidota bacterium]